MWCEGESVMLGEVCDVGGGGLGCGGESVV